MDNHPIIFVLDAFVHQKKFETFLAHSGLYMTAATMSTFAISWDWIIVLLLDVIEFTNHFAFTMLPYACHPFLGIGIANFGRERCVVLRRS